MNGLRTSFIFIALIVCFSSNDAFSETIGLALFRFFWETNSYVADYEKVAQRLTDALKANLSENKRYQVLQSEYLEKFLQKNGWTLEEVAKNPYHKTYPYRRCCGYWFYYRL